MSRLTAWFDALPVRRRLRAYLGAFDFFRGGDPEARRRTVEKIIRLQAEMRAAQESPGAPGVPHMRLGRNEVYCGRALGIPAIAMNEPSAAEAAVDAEEKSAAEEFQTAKDIAAWKVAHGLAEPQGPRPRKCAICDAGFTPSATHPHGVHAAICDECVADLRPPRPDPKPAPAEE